MEAIYTAKAVVSGGRDGVARTEDGQLELKLALPKLYISLISKNCTIAMSYCIDLNGDTLIPNTSPPTPINIYERSYIRPGDTTAASTNIMVYPRIVGPGKE